MFQELCGQSTLQNFVIITNGWGGWSDGAYALNEASMKKDIFFWLAINKGARFARNDNTITSAQNIIRLVLNNQPLPRIQSPDQNATVYHSIDNYSGGGEATRSPQDPDAPDVAIMWVFPLGYPCSLPLLTSLGPKRTRCFSSIWDDLSIHLV